MSKNISVVVPVMNEEDNIRPLFQAIRSSLFNFNYDLIIVDDGSTDQTVKIIREELDSTSKLVVFNKNYGQTTTMAAGIDYDNGDYIITLDGDLQNDPSDIPMMIQKMEAEEVDVVAGIRSKRKDGVASQETT